MSKAKEKLPEAATLEIYRVSATAWDFRAPEQREPPRPTRPHLVLLPSSAIARHEAELMLRQGARLIEEGACEQVSERVFREVTARICNVLRRMETINDRRQDEERRKQLRLF